MKAASHAHRPVNSQDLKTREPQRAQDVGNVEEFAVLGPDPNLRKPFTSIGRDLTESPKTAPPLVVQAKLVINQPGDRAERAADAIAARVVDCTQRPAGASLDEGEATEPKLPIPIVGIPAIPGGRRPAQLEAQVKRARTNGRPIAKPVRAPMEQAFGIDFSGVKIHTDALADRLNASMGAIAFTTGRDIFFRRGAFAPELVEGRELIAHELAHVVQQSVSPTLSSPGGSQLYVQRRLTVKATDADSELSDAQAIVDAFKAHIDVLRENYGLTVDEVLARSEFKAAVEAMLVNTIDEGVVVLDNDQLLCTLYLQLEGRVPGGRNPAAQGKTRTNETELENARNKNIVETQALEKYGAALRSEIGEEASFHDLAILGAGASVAYYLSSSGLDVDLNGTIIIGEEQPWESRRGKLGVVNHPMHMIAPDYQGKDLLEDGLASRQEFSKRIDAIVKKVGERKQQHVDSVEKVGTAVLYYKITSGKDVYYARRVVAGLGIGAQAAPDPKTIKQDGKETKLDDLRTVDSYPRVMSMDIFQQAVSAGRLSPLNVQKVIVVGANAAVDVMTTALRRSSWFRLKIGYDEIAWIATSPIFLMGTDNEFVKTVYEAATEKEAKAREQKLKSVPIAKRVEAFPNSYLGVDVGAHGVKVSYGTRARKDGEKDEPKGSVSGDIMVYGIGPDVQPVRDVFKNIDIVPAYDVSLRFNADAIDPQEVKRGIHRLLEKPNARGKRVEPDWADTFVEKVDNTIGKITAHSRPTEKVNDVETSDPKMRVKEPLLHTLPAVVGLRAAKGIGGKASDGDRSSLEILGGSAYRLGEGVRYTYVSQAFSALYGTQLAALEQALKPFTTPATDNPYGSASNPFISTFLSQIVIFAKRAELAAQSLENFKDERPSIKKSDSTSVLLDKVAKQSASNNARTVIDRQIGRTYTALQILVRRSLRVLKYLPNDDSATAIQARRLVTGFMNDVSTHFAQLDELRDIVFDYGSRTGDTLAVDAQTFMKTVVNSLPANVLSPEQLTSSRSAAEALRTHVTPKVAVDVNLITSDATVIVSHLAAGYDFIPPVVSQYVAARIVFDRRLAVDQGGPLPRPKNLYSTGSEYSLERQREFQNGWMKKFKELDALFSEMVKDLAKWTPAQ